MSPSKSNAIDRGTVQQLHNPDEEGEGSDAFTSIAATSDVFGMYVAASDNFSAAKCCKTVTAIRVKSPSIDAMSSNLIMNNALHATQSTMCVKKSSNLCAAI